MPDPIRPDVLDARPVPADAPPRYVEPTLEELQQRTLDAAAERLGAGTFADALDDLVEAFGHVPEKVRAAALEGAAARVIEPLLRAQREERAAAEDEQRANEAAAALAGEALA